MLFRSLITKLQPRFGEVWAFHGHNLAYNLSVMTSTPEERWRLVNAGIDLVRNKGLRYNPNDLILYKELAFWFAHKIDGVSDDAHLFYKRKFAQEWHLLLGPPPADKRHALFDAGHVVSNDLLTREVLDWLDRYLGPVP